MLIIQTKTFSVKIFIILVQRLDSSRVVNTSGCTESKIVKQRSVSGLEKLYTVQYNRTNRERQTRIHKINVVGPISLQIMSKIMVTIVLYKIGCKLSRPHPVLEKRSNSGVTLRERS